MASGEVSVFRRRLYGTVASDHKSEPGEVCLTRRAGEMSFRGRPDVLDSPIPLSKHVARAFRGSLYR